MVVPESLEHSAAAIAGVLLLLLLPSIVAHVRVFLTLWLSDESHWQKC